ncbi:MAG: hypothetical protein LBD74_01475 [Spirochaetaceae bacterium]|nr:hypothetical protein [Spirochaetaceae bacterium]
MQCFVLPTAAVFSGFSLENYTAPIRNFGLDQVNTSTTTDYLLSLGSALGYPIGKLRKIQQGDTTFEI